MRFTRLTLCLLLVFGALIGLPSVAQTPASPSNRIQAAGPLPSLIPPGANAAILRFEGEIIAAHETLLERRVQRALDQGASMIIFEFDTPGGELFTSLRISRNIKAIPVPTVAWINPEAYSGGTILASSCDEIVMASAATLGDAAPINAFLMNLAPTERAKVLSPLLANLRDNANRNGYDFAMYHAMCVLGVELYYIENPTTGDRRLVNQVDYQLMVHGSPSLAQRVTQGISDFSGTDVGNPTQDIATEKDFGHWRPVEVLPSGKQIPDGRVHDGKFLFTLQDILARDLELSRATLDTVADLETYFGTSSTFEVRTSWPEYLALFLSQWWVRGLLIALFFLGIVVESLIPGTILPGMTAVIALVGLFGSPIILGLASFWHLVLFVFGVFLLVIDLAFLIGFGFMGAAGLAIMIFAIIASVLPSGSSPLGFSDPIYWNHVGQGVATLILGGGTTLLVGAVLLRYFNEVPLFNRLMLRSSPAEGPEVSEHISGDEVLGSGRVEPGQRGEVVSSVMRPSGEVEIDGQRIDAITDGEYLTRGTPIRVLEIQGSRIVVERDDRSGSPTM